MLFTRFDRLMCVYNGLTGHVDEGPEVGVPARTNAEPIPVPLDDTGFPELPPTPRGGVKVTKVVQSMVREYCLAHVRESQIYSFIEIVD